VVKATQNIRSSANDKLSSVEKMAESTEALVEAKRKSGKSLIEESRNKWGLNAGRLG
jgi:hypothetical protein